MRLSQLGRELHVPDHDMCLLAAVLLRSAEWSAVFANGTELTEPAEKAIREHIEGLYQALAR